MTERRASANDTERGRVTRFYGNLCFASIEDSRFRWRLKCGAKCLCKQLRPALVQLSFIDWNFFHSLRHSFVGLVDDKVGIFHRVDTENGEEHFRNRRTAPKVMFSKHVRFYFCQCTPLYIENKYFSTQARFQMFLFRDDAFNLKTQK